MRGAGAVGAVLLAGGRGSRLGHVDKAALRLDGSTLLQRALGALPGLPVAVVGPPRPAPAGVVVVREDPPLSGPAAAVVAGLAALPPHVERVLLLAVDVVALPAAVPLLLDAAPGRDGVVAVDDEGRVQWLLSLVDVVPLRAAAVVLGDPAGAPLKALLGGLDLAPLRLPQALTADVDTVADALAAGVVLPGGTEDDG